MTSKALTQVPIQTSVIDCWYLTVPRQAQRDGQHDTLRDADRDEGQEPGGPQQPYVLPEGQQDADAGPQGEVTGEEQLKAFGPEAVNQVVAQQR